MGRVVLILASLLAASTAHAATYTVTSNADTGAGTLRQAITDAQASVDATSTITFSAALDGTTITLTGLSNDTTTGSKEFGASAFFIDQSKTLTIDASAGGFVHGVMLARDTVAADYPGSPATAPNFRLFDVGVGSTLVLRGLELSNGVAQGGGSGYGGGALGAGGGIFNQGTLIVERCTFVNNQASGGATGFATDGDGSGGGGVGAKSNPDDSGGGPNGGASGASGGFGGGGGGAGGGGFGGGGGRPGGAGGFGGGAGGVAGNGGFGAGGSNGNFGGGGGGMGGALFNDAGVVTLTNVTFTTNSAAGGVNHFGGGGGGSGYGGAIFNYAGSVTADFVTASGNSVVAGTSNGGAAGSAGGGAIYSLGDSNAACSAGGNTCAAGTATLTINNSIVANSTGAANDIVTNAINGGSETHPSTNTLSGPVTLGALVGGGGLEAVMVPPGGSAAIDAAGACTGTDQRGVPRPQGSGCDIGAVEIGRSLVPGTWTVQTNAEPAALYTNDCTPSGGSGGNCQTLRGAINNSISGDTIVFAAGLDGATIALTKYTNCLSSSDILSTTCLPRSSEWSSAGYVTQFGPSAYYIERNKTLTIDASAGGFVHGVTLARDTNGAHYPGAPASAPNFRLFDDGVGSALTLRGLKLSNGVAQGGGSGYGGGALGAGGAIFNQGALIIERSTFAGNTASGGSAGFATDGSGHGGGGVGAPSNPDDTGGGPNGGASPGAGGGFGGGGYGCGSGGSGGFGGGGGCGTGGSGGFGGGGRSLNGIGGFGGGDGGITSTSGGGGGGMGGALFNDAGSITLANVTFSGNSAVGGAGHLGQGGGGSGFGGAIFSYAGGLTADFVTASANSVAAGTSNGGAAGSADGGAIYSLGDSNAGCGTGGNTCAAGAATLTINNSIVANSSGAANDIVTNAINGGSETHPSANTLTGSVTLGALAAGAGLEAVMLPPGGSAAINAAPCGATSIDQRGILRPQGPACDIGAVEVALGPRLCYVNAAAAGAHTGATWTDAYTDLQQALGDFSCSQIWVRKGVYKPTATSDRTISFSIRPGLTVYGGFAGTESAVAQRVAGNVTTLSGDIGVAGNVSDNSYHVVLMDGVSGSPIDAATILDGFTITGGNADGYAGGGLYCYGESAQCSPLLANLVFAGNRAGTGGAIYNDGLYGISSPTITNTTFSGNSAQGNGGAIFNMGYGGVSNSSPTLTNVTFSGNSAVSHGGAIYNLGTHFGNSSPTLTNVTFSGNSATLGGAIYDNGGDNGTDNGNSSPTLHNVILWGDSASTSPEIYNDTATPAIDHSIVQGSGGSASWNAALGSDGGGNLDADPKLGTLADNGGVTQTLLPGKGSAAIDAGDNATCAASDQRGIARPQGPACDIGAVEVNTHAISGNLSGLAGSGLVLHLDYGTSSENLPRSANGAFAFVSAVPSGATYTISIGTQPSNLSQTCQVTQDSTGSMPAGNVTDVLVACTTNSYTVGGSVSGLTASGLTLQLNAAHDLAVPTNATAFVFASPLISGSSYVVSIKQQPSGRVCNVTNATGTVTSANVSSVTVTCVAAVSTLTLSIDDGHTYARYGMILDYLVTLSNSGNTTASNIDVSVSSPGTGLDLGSNTHWQCIGGDSAATCTATGTGAALGKATLPAGRSLTWIVSVPVTTVTADTSVELDAHATGAVVVKDIEKLVIFRDGFNAALADGTRAVTPAGATLLFTLPTVQGNAIEAIKTLRESDSEIRVERIVIGTHQFVRLLEHDARGVEHASAWAAANANATLAIGSINADGQCVMLLEGADNSLLLPLAHPSN